VPAFSFSNRGRQYKNPCTFPTLALLDGRPASQSPSPQPQTGVPFDGRASRSRTCVGAESEATGGPARKPTVSEGQGGKHPLRHRCERGRLAGNRMLAPPARHHRTAEARREASREGIGSTPPPLLPFAAATALVGPGYRRLLHVRPTLGGWVRTDAASIALLCVPVGSTAIDGAQQLCGKARLSDRQGRSCDSCMHALIKR
jgi:hypothetical protein